MNVELGVSFKAKKIFWENSAEEDIILIQFT